MPDSTDNTIDASELERERTRKQTSVRYLRVALVGLLDQIDDRRTQLLDERPNSEEAVSERDKALEFIDFVETRIDKLQRHMEALDGAGVPIVRDADQKLLDQVADEFRDWLLKNNPELVDAAMRLTPAAAFLGILGMAGASMTWATPIVLALCGGEKIVELLKKIKG